MSKMLVPLPWQGTVDQIPDKRMYWLKDLNTKTYCALWQRWPDRDLPDGYEIYIVSFHLEAVDIGWLHKQATITSQPIIVLTDSNFYDCPLPANVLPYKFYWWHHQLEQIKQWFPREDNKKITHKFSAVCNRITQSKLLITTVLLEECLNQSIIKLSDWEGLDSRITTNNNRLDMLYNTFYNKWYGKKIDLPDSKNFKHDSQIVNSNPWTEVYQNCALHFTNESFHYSYMQDELGHYVYPGPFITEKTLKCLVGATGFIPIGQYDTYNSLQELGFDFSYGIDLAFDQDAGNFTRLEKIIDLTYDLIKLGTNDLYDLTKTASKANQEHVYSNTLFNICEEHNRACITQVLDDFK